MELGILLYSLLWLACRTEGGVLRDLEEDPEVCRTYTEHNNIHLDCSDLGLMEMPDGLNYEATVLDLSNNNFMTFPEQLMHFTQLQILDLTGNRLSQPLPSYFRNLTRLHTLKLTDNNYEHWTGSEYIRSVVNLDLSKNKIANVSENAFREMPSITFLDLSENRLPTLSPTVFATINLQTLYLTRNSFSHIPSFKSSSIKILHINICQIDTLHADSFSGLTSLLEIDLSLNQISEIPDNLASSTLQELDLSYNEIISLNDRTFSSLPHLAVLNLRGNEFREVWSTSHFASNLYLREVHVKGNRWSCEEFSVNLLLTYEFLTREPSKVADRTSLMCYSPSNVTQMSWQQAYIRTWHASDPTESYAVVAVMIGIIIGIVITSFVCRGLMSLSKPDSSTPPENTVLNLNGSTPQPRVESVVMRIPLTEPDLPPTYDEALLMPRLNSSFHSLPDFLEEEDMPRNYRRSRSIGDLTEQRPRLGDRRSVRRTVEIRIDEH